MKKDAYKNTYEIVIDYDIGNSFIDVEKVIELQGIICSCTQADVTISFEGCERLDAAVSVLFGAIPLFCKIKYEKSLHFKFPKLGARHSVYRFMKSVGMYEYYTGIVNDYRGTDLLPFAQIKDEEKMDEYASEILRLSPIKMQEEAQDRLASNIYELYQNAFYHAKSAVGVFSAGHWLKEDEKFSFSIYDMGVGIPQNIRKKVNLAKTQLDSEKCMEIAFLEGFSTIEDKNICRGLGLARIESFIRLNEGEMRIFTDDICMIINSNGRSYKRLDNCIIGTLIMIDIKADDEYIYVLKP